MEQLTQFRIISLGLQVLLMFIGALTLGDCGHRADEHHVGERAATDARDRRREGIGGAESGIFCCSF